MGDRLLVIGYWLLVTGIGYWLLKVTTHNLQLTNSK